MERSAGRRLLLPIATVACFAPLSLSAAEHHGSVMFNSLPVPGAVVTAKQNGKQFGAITDRQGVYLFENLPDGEWRIEIQMTGFAAIERSLSIAPSAPATIWNLEPLPLEQIRAAASASVAPAQVVQRKPETADEATAASPSEEESARSAADGFLINGSINNAVALPFAPDVAFGNNRKGSKGLYTGGIAMTLDNSVLDATPYSLTGQNTPKPAYSNLTGMATLGGPLQIPHLLKNGPNLYAAYEWTRNRNATSESTLVPSAAQRNGSLPQTIIDPSTGSPFPGNRIPANRISPQANALLNLYPLPNSNAGSLYNYQVPIVSPIHQDALQTRLNKLASSRDQIYGALALQSTRSDTSNVFGFVDSTDLLGINTNVNWTHRFGHSLFLNLGYQFSRLAVRVTPFFENRTNVAGLAGISGTNQDLSYWGPPNLTFSSGLASLSDGLPSYNRNQTGGLSSSASWNHRGHTVTLGGDFRRQQSNYLSQQDPRGSFTFTGATAGSDFAGFLLGIPDTASIAFGNADKYFRQSAYDAYLADDWRIGPRLSLNAGVRWEYAAPITEIYGRLVNLDIAPGFAAAAAVLASDPMGSVTGQHFPVSLLRPDKTGVQPRIGLAWRPVSGSSMVVRAGYGVYYNTSIYQGIATQLAQQPPLSKTLSRQNNVANPFTLANAFNTSDVPSNNTFAIDPNFQVGYAQIWQASVQRDLPAALQLQASYLGIKGTRGLQEFLPNTVPLGAANPCPACPAGYVYLASNGNSIRHAAQIQLRRRLRSGVNATLKYTFSKSIDNVASLGGKGPYLPAQVNQSASTQTGQSGNGATTVAAGSQTNGVNPTIAQNWLDLNAERSLSNFDQRHVLSSQLAYTTGMGLGGSLLSGWKGALLKEWTFACQITASSGLPETPIYVAAVPGTGVTGSIRPDYTGAPLYAAPSGFYVNPAAYTAPALGRWGNAGRNSITGPAQFRLDASMGRTFRVSDRFNLDLRVDGTNALNRVDYTGWTTMVNNQQFGLPVGANAMRSLQTTFRLRF